jgi:hypothetical protein
MKVTNFFSFNKYPLKYLMDNKKKEIQDQIINGVQLIKNFFNFSNLQFTFS